VAFENAPETYIVSIPGTQESEELSRSMILERLARGEMTPAFWVWSSPDQDWKQISEFPSLNPPSLAEPETPVLFNAATAGTSFTPPPASTVSPIGPIRAPEPVSEKKSFFGRLFQGKKTAPKVRPMPKRRPVRGGEETRKRFPIFGFLVGSGLLALFTLIELNYQFIDRPLDGSLAQTPFVLVQAHAHLDLLVKPDTLVIHVVPSAETRADNFADFLFALAHSTPPLPFGLKPVTTVELTPSWLGEYAMDGEAWRQLAQMDQATAQERKEFVLDHLTDGKGQPLVAKALDGEAAKRARAQIWADVTESFTGS
jgi:hypothetical protein